MTPSAVEFYVFKTAHDKAFVNDLDTLAVESRSRHPPRQPISPPPPFTATEDLSTAGSGRIARSWLGLPKRSPS